MLQGPGQTVHISVLSDAAALNICTYFCISMTGLKATNK